MILILMTIQVLLILYEAYRSIPAPLHNPNAVYVGYIALDLIESSNRIIELKINDYSLMP